MQTLQEFGHVAHWAIHTPIGASILTAVATAVAADYSVFRSWKSWHDAVVYDWNTASWRWFQGFVVGLVAGLGLSVI